MKQINCNGSNITTAPVLEVDTPVNGVKNFIAHLDSSSRCYFQLPDGASGGATVKYSGKTARLIVPPTQGSWEADDPQVDMEPPTLDYGPPPSERITTNGRDFVKNGSKWIYKGVTDFALYLRYLHGEDITQLIVQRKNAGANTFRVIGMAAYMFNLNPKNEPNYYGALPAFARLFADHGCYLEFVAFADAQVVMPDQQEQFNHWAQVANQLRPETNIFLELVNEYPKNGVDPGVFSKPDGILCSRGSGLADEAPFLPGWDYHTWHGRRDDPKVMFSAEDMWYVGEGSGPNGLHQYPTRPVIHDEPIGFSDVNQPGRRSNVPYLARVMGLTATAYGAGGTFHSEPGLLSIGWSAHVDMLARTFFAHLI
jgi:hypothetical protein